VWSMWNAPSDRDYYEQFNPISDEEENENMEGWKQDAVAEVNCLVKIEEELDQLAAEAASCDTIAPEVKKIIDIAWYITAKALRDPDVNRSACGHLQIQTKPFCQNCHHFAELQAKAEQILRSL
jgi:hypothetical protein